MGLNPGRTMEQVMDDELDRLFRPNESPYFSMYTAGLHGIPIEKVAAKLTSMCIPVRSKDIQNWQEGWFKRQHRIDPSFVIPARQVTTTGVAFDESKLSDFPTMPISWQPPTNRFFPCTHENKPMQRWGWSSGFTPTLYSEKEARRLSPCGWVGQNMLYQRFIVIDIDGRGHGQEDVQTIEFGRMFSDKTFCMEDPAKPGSFHLYFATDKLIPVRHFPYAKIDLMGNGVNAAVYLKNKTSNGRALAQLDEQVWSSLMEYQRARKGQ